MLEVLFLHRRNSLWSLRPHRFAVHIEFITLRTLLHAKHAMDPIEALVDHFHGHCVISLAQSRMRRPDHRVELDAFSGILGPLVTLAGQRRASITSPHISRSRVYDEHILNFKALACLPHILYTLVLFFSMID